MFSPYAHCVCLRSKAWLAFSTVVSGTICSFVEHADNGVTFAFDWLLHWQALCGSIIATTDPVPDSSIVQLLATMTTHTASPQLHARVLAALTHLAADSDNCSLILSSGGLYRIAAVMAAYPDVPEIQHAALSVCGALMKIEPDSDDRETPDVGYGSITQAAVATLVSLPASNTWLIHDGALEELYNIASLSLGWLGSVASLSCLFQCVGSCMDMFATSVAIQRSACRLLEKIVTSQPAQAVLPSPSWLRRLKNAMSCGRESSELQDLACAVLAALPVASLTSELSKIILPDVIAAVQAHPGGGDARYSGYDFLSQQVHLRATFHECEGGAEVLNIAVSCCTAGCLYFHPMAQCVVHTLKGLACRARVTPASSPASHCKQCSALTSPARGFASPSCAR